MAVSYEDTNSVEIVNLRLDRANDTYNEDEDVDSDEEEFLGLLSDGGGRETNTIRDYNADSGNAKGRKRSGILAWRKATEVIVVLIGFLVLWNVLVGLLHLTTNNNSNSHQTSHSHLNASVSHAADLPPIVIEDNITTSTSVSVPYQCPSSIAKASNDKDGIFDYYDTDTERHVHSLNQTVDELLNIEYGAWGITPNQRKALNARWVHWYADAFLESSSPSSPSSSSSSSSMTNTKKTIYESACGVGLTLYVILELLQERYNITGLEIYGNEYIVDNVVTANRFYSLQQVSDNSPLHLTKGHICHGDSTNLTFVPSNAFDVVLTGYIDPIDDPLNLHLSRKEHKKYCKSKDKQQIEAMRQEQELVEDWFAAWTGEMIRIAKPGGTIVVESISQPRCLVGGWGGVAKDWWSNVAVSKYGWSKDIDPMTIKWIDFDPATNYNGIHDRYNVKMVKKKTEGRS